MVSKSQEEYLKTMFLLNKKNGNIRVTDIASSMNCTKPSVNKAINKLKDEGYIIYETYGQIKLTDKGEILSKKIIETYDIVYLFLKDILEIDRELARSEAEKIKQAMSDDTINSLARYVHKNLSLGELNCCYDINNNKCIDCSKRNDIKKLVSKTSIKFNKVKKVYKRGK